jgi:hypothetical protein
MSATNIRRIHAVDGVWEEEIGVVSRRKLTKASAAVDTVLTAIRETRDEFARRPPGHAADEDRDLASAIVERLISDLLLNQ